MKLSINIARVREELTFLGSPNHLKSITFLLSPLVKTLPKLFNFSDQHKFHSFIHPDFCSKIVIKSFPPSSSLSSSPPSLVVDSIESVVV